MRVEPKPIKGIYESKSFNACDAKFAWVLTFVFGCFLSAFQRVELLKIKVLQSE